MKKVFFLILVLPLTLVAQRPVIYNLPDAKLNSMTICGKPRFCDPGPRRWTVYRFAKAPYSPNVDNNSTLQSIAASVLGRAVSAEVDKNSEILRVCSKDGITSLISTDDVTPTGTYGVEGRSFNYRKTKKLAIDSKLAAKATIDELIKLSGSNKQLLFNEIGADLEIVYDKLKVGGLEIEANYSEWSLKQTTIDRINEAPDFEDCRKKLKEKNWAFITDIALIKYTISLNGENVKKFGATINAKLKREGVNVDIEALIEKEVHKSLTSQTVQGYQIIGWRKSKIE